MDNKNVLLGRDGGFAFDGLASGSYSINPEVQGYAPADPNRSLQIDHDVTGFTMLLEPDSYR